MQVSRIGLPQMLFPGFRPAHVQARQRPLVGAVPVVTRPVNRGALLGQAAQPDQAKRPLSIPFDDASKMLSSAEAVIAQVPACNLPVIDRFRAYVKAGSRTVNLELNAAEAAQLDQFALCAETKGQQGGKSAAADNSTTVFAVAGVAALALVGILFWNA